MTIILQIWLDVEDIEVEGRYVDTNGTPVTFFDWGTGQPDNKYPRRGGQDRVAMNKNTGKWFDNFEERRFQFICQQKVWKCISKVLEPTEEPTTSEAELEMRFNERPQSMLANIGSTVTYTASFQPGNAGLIL